MSAAQFSAFVALALVFLILPSAHGTYYPLSLFIVSILSCTIQY